MFTMLQCPICMSMLLFLLMRTCRMFRPFARSSCPCAMQKCKRQDASQINCHHCGHLSPDLLHCAGQCHRSFDTHCLPAGWQPPARPAEDAALAAQRSSKPAVQRWFCGDCLSGLSKCAGCGEVGTAGVEVTSCRPSNCGLAFHGACAEELARRWTLTTGRGQGVCCSACAADQ